MSAELKSKTCFLGGAFPCHTSFIVVSLLGIDISEPKQSHKVNEISQTVNHDQNQSHKAIRLNPGAFQNPEFAGTSDDIG